MNNEFNPTHTNNLNDKTLFDQRKWIDRVNSAPAKRRMWKKALPQPFPEISNLNLDPLPPFWVIGAKPRKKKRGRKSKKKTSPVKLDSIRSTFESQVYVQRNKEL